MALGFSLHEAYQKRMQWEKKKNPIFLVTKWIRAKTPTIVFIKDSSQLSDHSHFLFKKSDSAVCKKDYSGTNGIAVESGITNSVLRGD